MQDAWIPDTDDRDVIDETIGRLAARKGELEIELGRWLLAAERAQVHRALGFGSFAEYVERRVGYDARTTREKLRVARALEALPRLRAELTSGRRPWSVVREVARVITPETEVAWLESTERMTARHVAAEVAGRRPGDGPKDARDPLLMSRRMAFELPPEAYVLVHAALERARAELAPSASPGEVLRVLAEAYLGGRPTGGAGYQITVTVCASCEGTWQHARGDRIEVAGEIGACARCDGEIVGAEASAERTEGDQSFATGAGEQRADGPRRRAAGVGRDHRAAGVGRDHRVAGVGRDHRVAGVGRDHRVAGGARAHARALEPFAVTDRVAHLRCSAARGDAAPARGGAGA